VAQEALAAAEREAASAGVGGKELTPFLLRRMSELTSGRTLTANVALLKNNAAVAARLALALARSGR
jgi:pseudouridine-5'-phosphate glycosidase